MSPFAIYVNLSILTLTSLNLPSFCMVICSRAGVNFLQGPHQLTLLRYKNLLCIAIENNWFVSLHDQWRPFFSTLQFYDIWVGWKRRFCCRFRGEEGIAISIGEGLLLLLSLRLLLRCRLFRGTWRRWLGEYVSIPSSRGLGCEKPCLSSCNSS